MTIQVERSHPGVRYRLAVPDGWTSFPVQAARLRPPSPVAASPTLAPISGRDSRPRRRAEDELVQLAQSPGIEYAKQLLVLSLDHGPGYPSRQPASSRSCHGICPMTGQWQRSS